MNTIIRKICVFAVMLMGLFTFSNTLRGQSKDYLNALTLYYNKQYTAAAQLFDKVRINEPNNDAAYFYCALLSQDKSKTHDLLKKAIELDPNNFWYQYYFVLSYGTAQEYDLAAMALEQLIEQNPKRTSLYYDAINIYLNQNDADKALKTLDIIEQKKGKSETLAMTKLQLMYNLGKVDEAYQYLDDFYKEYQSPTLACLLGDFYAANYQQARALELFDEAIAMDAGFSEAYISKALLHRSLGQYDQFFENIKPFSQDPDVGVEHKIEILEELLENIPFVQTFMPQVDTIVMDIYDCHPTDTLLCPVVGGYYYQTGRTDKALEVFENCMEVYPNNADLAFTYTMILYYSEDWMRVIDNATVALHQFPGHSDLLQMRGLAYWNISEYESAIEDYKDLLVYCPQDSAILLAAYTALGDLSHTVGDMKQCYDYYKKALKVNPEHAPVLNNYAYFIALDYPKPVKRADKKLKEALRMSKITITQEPDNPTYLDTYAWLLHLVGQDIEAKALFKHAMIYGGKESSEVLNHYAEVLDALGEHDLAKVQRTMAKNLAPEL